MVEDKRSAVDVLIVDDVDDNVRLLEWLLEDAGYTVASASSGEQSVEMAISHQPDIILMDVMMPGMDGFAACRKLKCDDLTKDIPLIFITANGTDTNGAEGFSAGGVDFVTKPFHGPWCWPE